MRFLFHILPILILAGCINNPKKKAVEYYHVGLNDLEYKDYDNALTNFDKAIEYKPDFYEAYSLIGEIQYLYKKEFQKSINSFNKAIELQPDLLEGKHGEDFIFRGGAKMEMKDYRGAISDFEKSLEIVKVPYTYHKIGDCWSAIKDTAQACDYWKKAKTSGYNHKINLIDEYCKK